MSTRSLLGLVVIVCLAGAAAAQTECPHQTHISPLDYDLNVNSAIAAGQTFTAGVGGRLVGIEVELSRIGDPAGALLLELRATVDGRPVEDDSAFLAQQSVAPEDIDGPTTVYFDVTAAQLDLSPGDMYAVTLRSPKSGSKPGSDVYVVIGGGGNPYSGGKAYFRAFTPEWQIATNEGGATTDLAFTTYLDCSTPTESRSWSSVRASYR